MSSKSRLFAAPSPSPAARLLALRPGVKGAILRVLWYSLCALLVATLGHDLRPTYAAMRENTPVTSALIVPSLPDAAATNNTTRAYTSVVIELEAQPVAAFYAAQFGDATLAQTDVEDAQAQTASILAATQAHLASVEAAQDALVATLASYDAQVIYRVQRVMNGVAVYAPADQLDALRALPGVHAVYPLIAKEPANARIDNLLNTPAIWEGIDRAGLTGEGVSIAVIDTGLDYLHTMFGGPGKGYSENDTTIIGDVPNFPGVKVVGGFDFAGDDYDASPTSLTFQPIPNPDPDPMDCYSFGHGTHVAGTAAGYGVQLNGTTFTGPYDSTLSLSTLRIGPGMAPHAQLYALKVFGCTGFSNIVDLAIEWAVDPNQDGDFSDHVDVINLSLGTSFGSATDTTTIAVDNAAQLGIIVVASAGNTGDVHYAVGSPGMASRAIAVAATSINSADPDQFVDGTVASFSARGPARGDNRLKPDIAAPGTDVVSARRGTGTQSASSSGTSMASPAVAGIMALLRQAYPADDSPLWRARELKALVMNTARYPFLRPDIAESYSLLRVGAGRIDPSTALASALIAYDAAAPEVVSVNFGTVEALDHTTVVRAIRLANKSATPIAVTIAYSATRALPGVTVDVGVSQMLTVPAHGFATTPITLTVDAATLARRADPARQLVPVNAHPWVDEVSGYIRFTPVITSSGPSIHLPLLALPRLVSAFESISPPIDLGNRATTTQTLTLAGSAIANGVAPTQSVPLVGVFGLALSSPQVTETPTGESLLGRFAAGDLRYVGVTGPVEVDGERMLYFALVSYGDWSTPLEVAFQIAIDINNDDLADFRLQNREATDNSTFDVVTTDEFVSMLERVGGTRATQGPLNLFPATVYDTRPFMNNVMVLPLRLDDIGVNVQRFRYQIKTTSRDLENSLAAEYIDLTPILSYRLDAGAGIQVDRATPLFPATVGDELTLTFDRTAYIQQQLQGVLLLYMHNEATARTQVLPVQFDWDEALYLPEIAAVDGDTE